MRSKYTLTIVLSLLLFGVIGYSIGFPELTAHSIFDFILRLIIVLLCLLSLLMVGGLFVAAIFMAVENILSIKNRK